MVFLKNVVNNPHIEVGDYTYYHDFEDPDSFEKNVLYNFDFISDRLVIGKFCSIASQVRFIMNGGNHRTDWITNYPFPVFGNGWEHVEPYAIVGGNPARAIRKRFTDEDIRRLVEFAWWNRGIDFISEHLALICGGDVDRLMATEGNQ